MYGCENWTVKKAERRRIDAFELWCWKRLLRVPWTARTSNQSILKEICPGISLEGMMLKLKLQYFGHLMQRVDSLEKTLMLGGIGGRRRRGRQRMRWLDGINWLDGRESGWTPGVGDGQGGLECCDSWGRSRMSDWAAELNWTEPNIGWHRKKETKMAILLSETKLDLLACLTRGVASFKCKISGSFWIEIERVRYVLKIKYVEYIQSVSPMAPERKSISISNSVMSDSLWHYGL